MADTRTLAIEEGAPSSPKSGVGLEVVVAP
jgi:hypothetical protein